MDGWVHGWMGGCMHACLYGNPPTLSVVVIPDRTDFVELVEEDGISKLRTVACIYMAKRNEMKQKTRINDKDSEK